MMPGICGPIYSSSRAKDHEEKLASCYKTTLNLAADRGLKTIALCGVSTGIYGFPLAKATHIAVVENSLVQLSMGSQTKLFMMGFD